VESPHLENEFWKAYKDKGLQVVSDVDVYGNKFQGPHKWRAVGDAHLGTSDFGPKTKAMARMAVRASLRDLERVRDAGAKLGPQFADGAFIGQHGSWNRKPQYGYRVIFIPFRYGHPAGSPQDVLTGFLDDAGDSAPGYTRWIPGPLELESFGGAKRIGKPRFAVHAHRCRSCSHTSNE